MTAAFLVILKDRHCDDTITVHLTREGADAKVAEYMAAEHYSREKWVERNYGAPVWLRYVESTCGDGPSIRIESKEIRP